jgi:hypothetical protein
MRKDDVIAHFGGKRETANALGITFQAVHDWPEIVPPTRQYHVHVAVTEPLYADVVKCLRDALKFGTLSDEVFLSGNAALRALTKNKLRAEL